MSNTFIDIIREAHTHKWCTTPYCTTCGAQDYRKALRNLGEVAEGGLAAALADLNPSQLVKENNWQDALLVAVIDLPLSHQLEDIIKAWLAKFNDDIGFADFVLFKIIPCLSTQSAIRQEWINKSIALAKDTRNFSLIESLLLILKKDSLENPELIETAKDYAKTSRQMKRVLRNSCGID